MYILYCYIINDHFHKSGVAKRRNTTIEHDAAYIQKKVFYFWFTVSVIAFIWILILFGVGLAIFYRIVYLNHTVLQIFCPKD